MKIAKEKAKEIVDGAKEKAKASVDAAKAKAAISIEKAKAKAAKIIDAAKEKSKKSRKQKGGFPTADQIYNFNDGLNFHLEKYYKGDLLNEDQKIDLRTSLKSSLDGLFDFVITYTDTGQPAKHLEDIKKLKEAVKEAIVPKNTEANNKYNVALDYINKYIQDMERYFDEKKTYKEQPWFDRNILGTQSVKPFKPPDI